VTVLSQRLRISQATRLRTELTARYGQDGAFPAPGTLLGLDVGLPGRKGEYLRAVAQAALDGLLDGAALRALDPGQALQRVQHVKGVGPFPAELVVLRGANASDGPPKNEPRLDAEIPERYGPGHTLTEVSPAWWPYAPGPPCTCAPSASSAPARSPAAEPPGPPGHAQCSCCESPDLREPPNSD